MKLQTNVRYLNEFEQDLRGETFFFESEGENWADCLNDAMERLTIPGGASKVIIEVIG